MREKIPFDDFIKKQFSNYMPDVPAHVWGNIAANRTKKPKGFWLIFFNGKNILKLVATVIIGSSGYILFTGKNVQSKNNIVKSTVPASQVNASTNNIEKKINKDDHQIIADKIVPANQLLKEENNNYTDPSNTLSAVNNNNNTSSNRNNFSTPYSSQKNKIKNNTYPDEGDINKQSSPAENTSENNTTLFINKFFSPFIFNNARELTDRKKINSIRLPDCPSIEKNAAGNKKYWEAYGGPDYAFDNYKTFGDTASSNYLQKRKSSTKFSSAFSAGVRYTKVFDNGMSIKAGLNYSQVNEKFIYFNPNEIKYITVITTRVVIRQPGDTIYINDTLQYQQTGSRTKTTYNRYRTVDIPLVIGYELGNGKIHANINAGIIINVYSWYKGDVLDTAYQPVSITTGKGNSVYQFKNNIGVGFLGSISLYYKLTDKMHLLLEPYFRYNFSPMSKENLNLQQKYNTAGLRAGVRFDLK